MVLAGSAGAIVIALSAVAVATPFTTTTDAAMPPVATAQVSEAAAQAEEAAVAAAIAEAVAAAAAAAAAAEAEAQAEAQASASQSQIDAVVSTAMSKEGSAYVYGGSGPSAFDCSGFTMWVYQEALGVSLPHNTHAQWNAIDDTWYAGEKEPQPGDLVFFFNGADHVGLYIGNGMMIHAENPRTGVNVASIYDGYWANHLTGFGRVV